MDIQELIALEIEEAIENDNLAETLAFYMEKALENDAELLHELIEVYSN